MSKKQTIKEIFDEKINKDMIYKKTLLRAESNNKMFLNILKYSFVPLCIFCILGSVFIFYHDSIFKSNPSNAPKESNNIIYINEMSPYFQYLIAAHNKFVDKDQLTSFEYSEILEDFYNNIGIIYDDFDNYFQFPEGMQLDSFSLIYTMNHETTEYDVLNSYSFQYSTDSKNKLLFIEISSQNEPIGHFGCEGGLSNGKTSKINDVELIIYHFSEVYVAEFKYNHVYYYMDARNFEQEEFIVLLESIIQ